MRSWLHFEHNLSPDINVRAQSPVRDVKYIESYLKITDSTGRGD